MIKEDWNLAKEDCVTAVDNFLTRHLISCDDTIELSIVHFCPQCGKSHYRVLKTERTLVMWYPEYVDGVLVNSDPNKSTVHCQCMECGKEFSFEE